MSFLSLIKAFIARVLHHRRSEKKNSSEEGMRDGKKKSREGNLTGRKVFTIKFKIEKKLSQVNLKFQNINVENNEIMRVIRNLNR